MEWRANLELICFKCDNEGHVCVSVCLREKRPIKGTEKKLSNAGVIVIMGVI